MTFLGKESPPNHTDSPRDDLIPEWAAVLDKITLWQMDDAAGSIGKMLKKMEGNGAYCILGYLLTWDAVPSLEAEQAWVPVVNSRGVDTACQGFTEHLLMFSRVLRQSGTRVPK